jgi:murein tripeptide amidase MpaA
MPTADEINEQTTAAILDRIKSEATVSDKVRALVDAIDWIWSIQVNTDGAEPGRLTRFQQIFATVAVGYFFNAVGQNDLAREFQEIASTLSDLDRGIVRTSAEKRQRGPAVLNPSPLTFGERAPMGLPRSIR